MKLQCSVIVQNRLLPSLSMKSSTKYKNAVISIAKPGKESEIYLILFTQNNKSGVRYKIRNNIEKTFGQFSKEGKCTIRFKEPTHDLCISADEIPLKNFMLYVKKVWMGDRGVDPAPLRVVDVTPQCRQKSYKMEVKKKKDYPVLKGFPKSLQYLSVCDCNLSKVDSRILKLHNLTVLHLSRNKIKSIPKELGNLHLQEFYINNNDLKNEKWLFLLGKSIINSLNSLDLSSNEISSLPPTLSRFNCLKSLKVSKNKLTTIPFRICLLPQLQFLDLSYNSIKALPGTIKRRNMKKLDVLDVSGNNALSNSIEAGALSTYHHKQKHNAVFSLVELTGRRVIDSRLSYNEEILAFGLVRLLDNAGQCVCGKTTVHGCGLLWNTVEVKSIANTFVSTERKSTVPVVFTSCSAKYNTGV